MKTRKGFTIVELVVVIAVVAILAAVLIPSFSGVVEKTDRSTALKLAEAAYKEARAKANEDGAIHEGEEAIVDGFKFRFTADAASAVVVLYPDSFEYILDISNDEITTSGKRGEFQPDQNTPVVATTGITMYRPEITLEEGQSEIIHVSVAPANATDKTVVWNSSNSSVATVSGGLVTAVAEGTTTIRASSAQDDTIFAECTVKVERVKVKFVSLNSLNLSFTMGDVGRQLTATVKPDNAADNTVTWRSENPNIVEVSEGFIAPKNPGYTEIVATAGGVKAKCGITVNGFVLGISEKTIRVGEMLAIPAVAYPTGTIVWTSDNGCVTVNPYGVVTANSVGTATITAGINGFFKTCTIKVEEADVGGETPETPVSSITLSQTAASLTVGKTSALAVTKENIPNDAAITWESNNADIATVDGNGVVTAVAVGDAVITVKATKDDHTYTATCTIKVVETSTVTSIALDKTTATIIQGDTVTLVPTVVVAGGETYAISWVSDTESVATVDANGVVTGVGNGKATITAKVGGHSVSCEVTVRGKYSVTVNATASHILFGGDLTVIHGDTYTAILAPNENCAILKVTVKNGNNDDVEVDIVDKKITVENVQGDLVIDVTTVHLTPTLAESVTLNKNTLELGHGASETLTATVLPAGADQSLTWHSSNTNVASVDANGKITAHNAGSATITVFTSNGKTATCEGTVTGTPVTGVTLNKTELTLDIGGSETLIATVEPDGASNQNVIWKTNNNGIATVVDGMVTGISAGTTTIVVITEDGTYIDVCTVTVTASGDVGGGAGSGNVAVTGVTLDYDTLTVGVGLEKELTATVSPDNATNKTVTWTSSDPSIATVDQNGVVTGVAVGEATITATTEDGKFSATCTVNVKNYYSVEILDGSSEFTIEGDKIAFADEDYTLELKVPNGYIITGINVFVNGRDTSATPSYKNTQNVNLARVNGQITVSITSKVNLLNIEERKNGYYLSDDGTLAVFNDVDTSGYIDIQGQSAIILRNTNFDMGTTDPNRVYYMLAFYSSEKELIKCRPLYDWANHRDDLGYSFDESGTDVVTLTIKGEIAGAAYFRISTSRLDENSAVYIN